MALYVWVPDVEDMYGIIFKVSLLRRLYKSETFRTFNVYLPADRVHIIDKHNRNCSLADVKT